MTEAKKPTPAAASGRAQDSVEVEVGAQQRPMIAAAPAPRAQITYLPLDPGAIIEAGAAHSLAGLFEGMVQNQLYANNIMAATTARCVNFILERSARERAETLEMFRET